MHSFAHKVLASRLSALLGLLCLISPANSIRATPNSPCGSVCVDSTSLDTSDPNSYTTQNADVVCNDDDFTGTTTGIKWQQCMTCLQSSKFSQGSQSDQTWFIYNLRYSFDYCAFGYPNRSNFGSSPCVTDAACGPLQSPLEQDQLDPQSANQLAYCDASGGAATGSAFSKCLACVSTTGNYVGNTLVGLESACLQRPNATAILGLNSTIFSPYTISIVDPASLVKSTSSSGSSSLGMAPIAGIVAGVLVGIAVIAGFCFVRHRKRRNRVLRDSSWKKHNRQSSLSMRCHKILGSPLSPKFFRNNVQEPNSYASLSQMMQTKGEDATSPSEKGERHYISSRPRQNPTYTVQGGQVVTTANAAAVSGVQSCNVATAMKKDKKLPLEPIKISTSDLAPPLVSPPASTYQFGKDTKYSPHSAASEATSYFTTPTSTTQLMPPNGGLGSSVPHMPYNPALHTAAPAVAASSHGSPQLGSGPLSPGAFSPRMAQHGWPITRDTQAAPWFPPPPPTEPPRKGGKYGKKKGRKEAGSPVESRQLQTSFAGPPR